MEGVVVTATPSVSYQKIKSMKERVAYFSRLWKRSQNCCCLCQ